MQVDPIQEVYLYDNCPRSKDVVPNRYEAINHPMGMIHQYLSIMNDHIIRRCYPLKRGNEEFAPFVQNAAFVTKWRDACQNT